MGTSRESAPSPAPVPWVVEASVADRVVLANGEAVGRDNFHGWLWEQAQGLLGVNEEP